MKFLFTIILDSRHQNQSIYLSYLNLSKLEDSNWLASTVIYLSCLGTKSFVFWELSVQYKDSMFSNVMHEEDVLHNQWSSCVQ